MHSHSAKFKRYLLILCAGGVLLVTVVTKYILDIQAFKEEFQQISSADAHTIGERYSNTITTMYQGLRTIARLPGTRKIDRYAENLDDNTRQSIQEIYNNLYDNITLSEVYIMPVNFDPDVFDPNTGKPSEPIITFDEFIVGQIAEEHPTEEVELEEIEIHEYRLMKEQIQWMIDNYPTESHIKGLEYPAISGKEVVTCDNSMFSTISPNDSDRSGIVYSVPFYDPAGILKGIVSGVILSNRLREYLPNGNYAINNAAYDYLIKPIEPGPWQNSLQYINNNKPDPTLSYSDTIKLDIIDVESWYLWVGISNDYFWSLPRVRTETNFFLMAIIFVLSLIATIIIIIRSQYKLKDVNYNLHIANEAKTEFLSRMSHELRTPLNAIIGYSEMILEDDYENKIQPLEDCMKIRQAGAHLLCLINDVLDLEKIESGHLELTFETFDINELVNSLTATVKPQIIKNNNDFEIIGLEDNFFVHADKLKLKQILLNILSNAAKFTENGSVKFKITKQTSENKNWILFRIEDTGIGIPSEKLQTIFEEFSQADSSINVNYGGTGLGLTISKRFSELMQGKIHVESKEGVGTSFTLWLPSIGEDVGKTDSKTAA